MSATEKRGCCQCLVKQSGRPSSSHDEIKRTKRALKRYVNKQLQKIESANKELQAENPDQLLNKPDSISKRTSICLCGTLCTILYYITGCFIIRAICCKRKHDDVDSDSEMDSEDEDSSKTWRGKIKTILLCLSGYWLFRKCSDYCCAICKSGSKQLFWKIVGWGIFAIFVCVIVFSRYFRLLGYLVVEGFFSLLSILMRFTGGIPIDGTIDTVVIQTRTVYDDLAGNSNSVGNLTLAPSMPIQPHNTRLRKTLKPTSRPTSSIPVLSPPSTTISPPPPSTTLPSMSPSPGSQAPTPSPSIMQIHVLQPSLTTAPTSTSAIKSASLPPTINVLDFYRVVESHITQAPPKHD